MTTTQWPRISCVDFCVKILLASIAINTYGCANEILRYGGQFTIRFIDSKIEQQYAGGVKLRRVFKKSELIGYKIAVSNECLLSCVIAAVKSAPPHSQDELPTCMLRTGRPNDSYIQTLFTDISIKDKFVTNWETTESYQWNLSVGITFLGITPGQYGRGEMLQYEFNGLIEGVKQENRWQQECIRGHFTKEYKHDFPSEVLPPYLRDKLASPLKWECEKNRTVETELPENSDQFVKLKCKPEH